MIAALLAGLEAVFGWLLEASWQASVLVALVLLLQVALRGRLNPRWHHALWLLVIARLLLPFLPESALSLFQFAPSPPSAVTETVTEPIFHAPAAPMVVGLTPAPAPATVYPFSVFTVLALIWFTGAVGLLILTWQVNRRFARHVGAAPPVTDPRLFKLAESAQQELGLHRRLRIIESAQVQSPAIMGLFHPTLILPKDVRTRFVDAELRFIFLHEFAHLKRGDLFLQWLVALLQILHWFNPVLWYAFRRMRADREPATDALVLSCTGEAQKESYGHVLVKLLEHYHQRHSLPTLVGILEDKDQFKRRFSLIAKFTRDAYGWSVLGILLIGILTVVCLTRAKTTAQLVDNPTKIPQVGNVRIQYLAIDMSEGDYQVWRQDITAAVFTGLDHSIHPMARCHIIVPSTSSTGYGHAFRVMSANPSIEIGCTPALTLGKISIAGNLTMNSSQWSEDANRGRVLTNRPIPGATFPFAGSLTPTQVQAIPPEGIEEPPTFLPAGTTEPRRLILFVSAWPESISIAQNSAPKANGGINVTDTNTQITAAVQKSDVPTMSEAEARQKGIAALVNGEPIYWSDVDYDYVFPGVYLKMGISGDALKQVEATDRLIRVDQFINREVAFMMTVF